MKLKNPMEMRQLYADKCNWFTLTEIAKGTKVGIATISSALDGNPVRPSTIKALAAPLEKKPTEIAEFVVN